jgi:dipeptide/tripeptide permease
MGVWFLANSAANYVGGFIARYTPTPGQPPAEAASGFGGYIQSLSGTNQGFYMIFVIMAFGAGALMFVCIPLLKKLTASVKA